MYFRKGVAGLPVDMLDRRNGKSGRKTVTEARCHQQVTFARIGLERNVRQQKARRFSRAESDCAQASPGYLDRGRPLRSVVRLHPHG